MPDPITPTSGQEPVADAATSTPEPDVTAGGEGSTEAPQPIDDLSERMKRLEANLKGREMELQRERESRQLLENELRNRQVQPAPQPQIPQYNEDDEAKEYQTAMLNSDYSKMRQIERGREARIAQIAAQSMAQSVYQVQAQNSLHSYLKDAGYTPGTDAWREVDTRVRAMAIDPRYSFVSGNPAALTALAVNELAREKAGTISTVKETRRQESVSQSFTEGSSGRPASAQKPQERIYLNDAEKQAVRWKMKRDGVSQAAAEKAIWELVPSDVRESRKSAKRA